MSRIRLLLVTALMLPSVVAAQDANAWRDSTYRLAAEVEKIRDSLRKAARPIEEIARRPGLMIAASASYRPIAEEALDRFDRMRRRWFGEATPSEAGFRLTLRHGDNSLIQHRGAGPESLAIVGFPDTGAAPRLSPMVERRTLAAPERAAQELLSLFGDLMLRTAPRSIQRWIPAGLQLFMSDTARRERAMYVLVTGDGRAQRACVLGSADACAYSVGLRPSAIQYPGGQYYHLARTDLLLFALDQGGSGAWERLRDDPEKSVEAALAAAAGIPPDSLIDRWRSGLLAIQPDHGPISHSAMLVLLGWGSVFLAAALGIARWA